jgi:hypothetical protein
MMEDAVRRFWESVERLKANPDKVDAVEYQWWTGENWKPIEKKSAEIKEADLQVRKYEGMKEDGHTPEVWIRVYDLSKADAEGGGVWTFNISFPCPPKCGGG